MLPQVEKSMKKAIKYWHKRARGIDCKRPCPVCPHFKYSDGIVHCQGCPVSEHTGMTGCQGTAYFQYHKSVYHNRNNPEALRYANQMVGTLIASLYAGGGSYE